MMNYLLCLTLFAAFGNALSGHCDPAMCILQADTILAEKYECVQTPDRVTRAIYQCGPGCPQSVTNQVIPYGQVLQQKEMENNCQSARASPCNPVDIVTCALETIQMVTLAASFQINNLDKLCKDVGSVVTTLDKCSRCIVTAIPGYEVFADDILKYVNISFTMVHGACNCSRDLVTLVGKISNDTGCDLVDTIVKTVKVGALDCGVKLINLPLQLPWLDMINTYLSVVLPASGNLCILFTSSASALRGTSFWLMVFTAALTLIMLKRHFHHLGK